MLLSERAITAQLCSTLLREFPGRDVHCFSAPGKVVNSLLHSAKGQIPLAGLFTLSLSNTEGSWGWGHTRISWKSKIEYILQVGWGQVGMRMERIR